MSFEFYNPHKCVITCTLPAPFGQFKVMSGEYVPSTEQEKSHITAAILQPFVAPSFLRKTPPHIRSRLRLESEEKAKTEAGATVQPAAVPVATQPVASPQLASPAPVVVDNVQTQQDTPVVAPAQEISVPSAQVPVDAAGASGDPGGRAPNAPEGSVTVTLSPEQAREIAGVPVVTAPSAPLELPRQPISLREREEASEGTMSMAKSTRVLEAEINRKSSVAQEGKKLR